MLLVDIPRLIGQRVVDVELHTKFIHQPANRLFGCLDVLFVAELELSVELAVARVAVITGFHSSDFGGDLLEPWAGMVLGSLFTLGGESQGDAAFSVRSPVRVTTNLDTATTYSLQGRPVVVIHDLDSCARGTHLHALIEVLFRVEVLWQLDAGNNPGAFLVAVGEVNNLALTDIVMLDEGGQQVAGYHLALFGRALGGLGKHILDGASDVGILNVSHEL